jgi:hypothetical protein
MNYLQALHEKGILKDDYSSAIQKKIDLLEAFQEKEDITEDDEADFAILEQDLIKSIKKFNPEVYNARKERLAKVPRKGSKKPKEVQEAKQVQEVQEDVKIAQKLYELKEKVQVRQEMFDGGEIEETKPEPVEVETEEIDDYKKTETVKPKKMSTSFMLMGIGVFFLTWGGINLWRERR